RGRARPRCRPAAKHAAHRYERRRHPAVPGRLERRQRGGHAEERQGLLVSGAGHAAEPAQLTHRNANQNENIEERSMFTRRDFIRNGVALVSLGEMVPSIFRKGIALAQHDSSDVPERTLVVLQLAGGNDGLNTVVPYNDGAYHSLRPTLGLGADK